MPARRAVMTSPTKPVVSNDLLSYKWCITDRMGVYVHDDDYAPEEGSTRPKEDGADTLIRAGTLTDVSWTAKYSVEGVSTACFKLQVHINAYGDEPAQTKLYAVIEDSFLDFSDDLWRDNYTKESELVCTNIDPQLLEAWSTRKKGTGNWLKQWFKSKGGSSTASAVVPEKTQTALPQVFGAAQVPLPPPTTTPASLQASSNTQPPIAQAPPTKPKGIMLMFSWNIYVYVFVC